MTRPPLKPGDRVRTSAVLTNRDFSEPGQRLANVVGVVTEVSDAHGLCYRVAYDYGGDGWFDPDELDRPPPELTVVQILAAARAIGAWVHSIGGSVVPTPEDTVRAAEWIRERGDAIDTTRTTKFSYAARLLEQLAAAANAPPPPGPGAPR